MIHTQYITQHVLSVGRGTAYGMMLLCTYTYTHRVVDGMMLLCTYTYTQRVVDGTYSSSIPYTQYPLLVEVHVEDVLVSSDAVACAWYSTHTCIQKE